MIPGVEARATAYGNYFLFHSKYPFLSCYKDCVVENALSR
jgi:hypothetical protein